jgi:hypothetical protein
VNEQVVELLKERVNEAAEAKKRAALASPNRRKVDRAAAPGLLTNKRAPAKSE